MKQNDKIQFIAIKNALDYTAQLACDYDEDIQKRIVMVTRSDENEEWRETLQVLLDVQGPDEEDAAIFDKIFIQRSVASAFAGGTLQRLKHALDNLAIAFGYAKRDICSLGEYTAADGTSWKTLKAIFEDLDSSEVEEVLATYLTTLCPALKNEDVRVMVTEDQGEGEETKTVDEDFMEFFPDGTSDGVPVWYPPIL